MFGPLTKPLVGAMARGRVIIPQPDARWDFTTGRLVDFKGVAATVTRATTGTLIDWEVLKTAKIGEARFRYLDRVENLIPTPSNTLAIAGNKTMTLAAGTYVFSMGPGTGTATFSGTGGATGTLAANATLRTAATKTITAGTLIVTASVAALSDLQCETGSIPSEYVSVGVLSAPYHGAGVDGVKYFTYANGNTVDGSGVVTEAQGAALPQTYGVPGLMVEEQRTNKALQNCSPPTSWGFQGGAIAANQVLCPDGSISGAKFTESTATSGHGIYNPTSGAPSYTVGTVVTGSMFVRAGTGRYYWLSLTQSANAAWAIVDTQTWTITATGADGTGVFSAAGVDPVSYAGGFRRIWVAGATGQTTYQLAMYRNPTPDTESVVFVGDGVSTIYFWGVQIEQGLRPSSLIVTTTGTITRNADQVQAALATGAEWSFLVSGIAAAGTGTQKWLCFDDATANERAYLERQADGTMHVIVVDGGVQQCDLALGAVANDAAFKVAGRIKANDFAASLNGAACVTDTGGTVPTTTKVNFGQNHAAVEQSNGTHQSVNYYARGLSDAQLQRIAA